jgi:hypothetical protein
MFLSGMESEQAFIPQNLGKNIAARPIKTLTGNGS